MAPPLELALASSVGAPEGAFAGVELLLQAIAPASVSAATLVTPSQVVPMVCM